MVVTREAIEEAVAEARTIWADYKNALFIEDVIELSRLNTAYGKAFNRVVKYTNWPATQCLDVIVGNREF